MTDYTTITRDVEFDCFVTACVMTGLAISTVSSAISAESYTIGSLTDLEVLFPVYTASPACTYTMQYESLDSSDDDTSGLAYMSITTNDRFTISTSDTSLSSATNLVKTFSFRAYMDDS
jgi:hypothetical protein